MKNARTLKTGLFATSLAILAAVMTLGGFTLKEAMGQESAPGVKPLAVTAPAADMSAPAATVAAATATARSYDFFAIALTVGVACLSAGYAVAKVGSAALGVIAERPESFGRALIFVGLAEGIAIYGLIFGILMLRALPQ